MDVFKWEPGRPVMVPGCRDGEGSRIIHRFLKQLPPAHRPRTTLAHSQQCRTFGMGWCLTLPCLLRLLRHVALPAVDRGQVAPGGAADQGGGHAGEPAAVGRHPGAQPAGGSGRGGRPPLPVQPGGPEEVSDEEEGERVPGGRKLGAADGVSSVPSQLPRAPCCCHCCSASAPVHQPRARGVCCSALHDHHAICTLSSFLERQATHHCCLPGWVQVPGVLHQDGGRSGAGGHAGHVASLHHHSPAAGAGECLVGRAGGRQHGVWVAGWLLQQVQCGKNREHAKVGTQGLNSREREWKTATPAPIFCCLPRGMLVCATKCCWPQKAEPLFLSCRPSAAAHLDSDPAGALCSL